MIEKLATLASGRLSAILSEGLCGHHPLFDPDAIRAAFDAPAEVVDRDDALAIGKVLLSICREPLATARGAVDALDPQARDALIRLYFRLLDRAREAPPRH